MLRLDGFGLFVKDMPSMVSFYKEALGFEIKEEGNASSIRLEKDGTLFMLRKRTAFEKMSNHGAIGFSRGVDGQHTIALSVKNFDYVDRAYADVIRNGAIPIMPPTTTPERLRICYVSDPEGNLIEIYSNSII